MAPGRAQAIRDLAVFAVHAAALCIVARWAWAQATAVGRDAIESVRRHNARRDALARAVQPRSIR